MTVQDFQLAPNFSFFELTSSGAHPDLVEANRLYVLQDIRRVVAITALAAMLQQLRDHFGRPVVVHSGCRSPALNKAVGGQPDSQHLAAQAADLHVDGVSLATVYRWITEESALRYGQCLLEGVHGAPPTWIHLSLGEPWRPADRSRQHSQVDATTNTRVSPG